MKYFFLKTWGNIDIKHILKFIQIRGVQTRTYVTLYLRNFTPDNIEIRMIHNDVPAAYAIGMNKSSNLERCIDL